MSLNEEALVGLFGLSAITIQTRRKEIGIRKGVGANVPTIVKIVSKEFMILVTIVTCKRLAFVHKVGRGMFSTL